MNETHQKPRSFGLSQLAQEYSPELSPSSAIKRLNRWIETHPTLSHELTRLGWIKGNRRLTPRQVECIFINLGEP